MELVVAPVLHTSDPLVVAVSVAGLPAQIVAVPVIETEGATPKETVTDSVEDPHALLPVTEYEPVDETVMLGLSSPVLQR